MEKIKELYEVGIRVDFTKFHYVGDARAFTSHLSRNTSRVHLRYEYREF